MHHRSPPCFFPAYADLLLPCVPVAKNAPLFDNDSFSAKAACFHFRVPPNCFQKICFKSVGPKMVYNL